MNPADLAGVLITHEHTDHIAGLATLAKQFRLPVYASRGTGLQLCYRIAFLEELLRPFSAGESFAVDGLAVESFATPHDTAEERRLCRLQRRQQGGRGHRPGPCDGGGGPGYPGTDLLVAEANHDVDWVQSGTYPYFLKARILGDRGHLSNEAGAQLARSAVEGGARTVVLAHLSAENNTPVRAYDTVRAALEYAGAAIGRDVTLEVAPRAETSRRFRAG